MDEGRVAIPPILGHPFQEPVTGARVKPCLTPGGIANGAPSLPRVPTSEPCAPFGPDAS